MTIHEAIDINRLPLANPEFTVIREENKIYVDKTELIYKIASQDSPLFFSRPRRFGKSLLINTLSSLFADGLKYFQGLSIEKIWNDKTYHVVHLDFSDLANKNPQKFEKDFGEAIVEEFDMKGSIKRSDEFGVRSPDRILNEIAKKLPNKSVVLLIDEYDAPLTHHINTPDELKSITNILNDFYATVKRYTGKFRLIFITGVTRASHVSIFSSFNNLIDISLNEEFNSLVGFTQNELIKYFDQYIDNSSQILGMQKDDLCQRLEQYYNGFQFSLDAKETIYNPWSILNFFKASNNGFKNYWYRSSGSSSIIMNYLKKSNAFNSFDYKSDDLYIDIDKLLDHYEITNIPVNILLLQTGYFTIRKHTNKFAKLVFPNTEVEDSILKLYLYAKNIEPDFEKFCSLDDFIDRIDKKDLSFVVNTFNEILNDCVSSDGNIFHDERSVRDIIYAALPQEINLQKIKERATVKGRSDLELLTKKTRMVIEFKRTTPKRNATLSLQAAINQIKNNKYGIGPFQTHNLYCVAMVISTEEKAILLDFCQEINL